MRFTATIANLGKYNEGVLAETELSLPATTEAVQAALCSIGVDGLRYEEVIATEYSIDIDGIAPLLGEFADIDELNYLALRIDSLSPEDMKKFTAAVRLGEYAGSLQDLINLSYPCNLELYELLPEVRSYEDYGRHLVDTRREFSLPKEAEYYFDYESYGEDTVINEGGETTPQGYIYNTQSKSFEEIYDGREIPQEYRVFQYPVSEKLKKDAAKHGHVHRRPLKTGRYGGR